ncbi:MAG: hypothetical protein WCO00_04495 [Rhodospirillaceae bacterium]
MSMPEHIETTDDDELAKLFEGVPDKITKPKKSSSNKKEITVETMKADKIIVINKWIEKVKSDIREDGKKGKGNLSTATKDPKYVELRLPHGPGGNFNIFTGKEWIEKPILPAVNEVKFWEMTIKRFELGVYDAECERIMKKRHDTYYDENGVRRPKKPKKVKKADAAAAEAAKVDDHFVVEN